ARAPVGPALDPGEGGLDARAVAPHAEVVAGLVAPVDGHQIFGAREDEDVGLDIVEVTGQPLVRLAGDGGDADLPPHAERTGARARVILKGEAQIEPAPAG